MNRIGISALLLLGLVSCSTTSDVGKARYRASNVVILVIDGPRQSEMWGDPDHKHIPQLSGRLAPEGTLMSGFRCNGVPNTASGHGALCTGVYESIENSTGEQLPAYAGIFQHFLEQTGLPKEKAWVIVSKDKLANLVDTFEPGWRGKYTASVWAGKGGRGRGAGYAQDSETMQTVENVLHQYHPRLVLVNLRQPDSGGHSGDWEKYVKGMESSDAYAGELWDLLRADEFYAGRTAYFITHDHGRHLDGVANGWISHGDDCEGCRHIALLALGPDFKRGVIIPEGGEQIDLPVTVGKLLGFKLPHAEGRVLTELFQPATQPQQ